MVFPWEPGKFVSTLHRIGRTVGPYRGVFHTCFLTISLQV